MSRGRRLATLPAATMIFVVIVENGAAGEGSRGVASIRID